VSGDARQPGDVVRELLDRVIKELDLAGPLEVEFDGETVRGTVHGTEMGVFIGRHGQTIEAVQHLAQRMTQQQCEGERVRVVIDAEGYRARREQALHGQADDAAGEAVRFGRPVALDAMAASERRLVHEYLRDRGDVETYSEGDEPDRHLVVAPLSS